MQQKRNGPRPLSANISYLLQEYALFTDQGMGNDNVTTDRMQQYLQGVKKYMESPYKRAMQDLPIAWKRGEVSVFAAQSNGLNHNAAPILMIPSMINKSTILDLKENRSFVRWFSEQGRDAYLLDWGDILRDPEQQSMEQVICEKLAAVITELSAQHKRPIHLMGYCMGGTLSLAAAQLCQKDVASLAIMAAPWDFHQDSETIRHSIKMLEPIALPSLQEENRLRADWLQLVFSSLDPQHNIQKYIRYAELDESDDKAELFVATEDWLNDTVDLPKALAQACLHDWYRDNLPAQRQWVVDSIGVVDPSMLQFPTYIIAARKDKLVSKSSSLSLLKDLQKPEVLEIDCGHIGLIAGQRSIESVWSPYSAWLQNQEA